MPYAVTDDDVRLYYEETGSGFPVVFVHEFAGDHRSWEPQVRCFSRRYRCITYDARGYPPSDVPDDLAMYSQERATEDVHAVLTHLGIERAHVVGLSMGGFATLHFGLRYADHARSLVVAGCGYGAEPSRRSQFQAEAEATARMFEDRGAAEAARTYAAGPTRVQFRNKDARGYGDFAAMLAEHSAKGAALTMRGVQKRRPSLWDLEAELKALRVPTLLITGDEDEPCLEPALFLKRTIGSAGLLVIPKSGHTINLEEPDLFNRALQDLFTSVETGAWTKRDPRSIGTGIMGLK